MESVPCERCGGSGKIYVDDLNVRQCLCLYRRTLAAHLIAQFGAAIKSAPPVYLSPLYQEPKTPESPPKIDRTGDNLFLKGWWSDLLGHFRWALGSKGPLFPFFVTTDERVRTVYVGSESYVSRSRKIRDDVEAYNSLHDLIGGQHRLVILRLGFLGYKNAAMAGALLEALRIREVAGTSTWVVEEPNSPLGPGHFSYSPELAEYLGRTFEVVDLVQNPDREAVPRGVALAPDDDLTLGPDDAPRKAFLPTSAVRRLDDSDPVLSGVRKRPGGYRKRGSGPLGAGS